MKDTLALLSFIAVISITWSAAWAQAPDESPGSDPRPTSAVTITAPPPPDLLKPPDFHPARAPSGAMVSLALPRDDDSVEVIELQGSLAASTGVEVSPASRVRYAPVTSVNRLIETVPGVTVNEGDAFGSDDWSTLITIRGLHSEGQHIATTIDGLPNGGSNYGGGAKANRFVDAENLATVSVAHGATRAASWSREALGGAVNYVTDDPRGERGARAGLTSGTQGARRLFLRLDTGDIRPGLAAYGSYSNTFVDNWQDRTGIARRDHAEIKVRGDLGPVSLAARYSYDDVHENNYQTVSLEQFRDNPAWDRLTDSWRGIPYIDQAYRGTWATLRTNHFAYLEAEFDMAGFDISVTPYHHRMRGRGDWSPPYQVEVDGAAPTPGETRYGGSSTATIHYTDGAGTPLTATEGCAAEFTFPYGNSGPAYHPDCYAPGAVPVSSYRHTHYQKTRLGARLEATRRSELTPGGNRLRVGLWYEDYRLERQRDWHRMVDATSSPRFEEVPYWVQFDRFYSEQLLSWHVLDQQEIGRWTLHGGVQQFITSMERWTRHDDDEAVQVRSNARPRMHARVVYRPGERWQLAASVAESQATVKEFALDIGQPLEVVHPDTGAVTRVEPLADIQPETAQTAELSARFTLDTAVGSLSGATTIYATRFANRITEISTRDPESGIDFLEVAERGIPRNIGGIEARGVEAMVTWRPTSTWRVFGSFSYNHAVYRQDVESAGVVAGNQVIMAPRDTLLAGLEYRDPVGLLAGVTVRHVGDYAGTLGDAQGNQERIPAYSLVNAHFAYPVARPVPGLTDITVALHVNNLTDARYLTGSPGGAGAYLLGARRSATLTVGGQL